MNIALLECPGCKNIPDYDDPDFVYPVDHSRTVWAAHCTANGCGCGWSVLGGSLEEAVAKWNGAQHLNREYDLISENALSSQPLDLGHLLKLVGERALYGEAVTISLPVNLLLSLKGCLQLGLAVALEQAGGPAAQATRLPDYAREGAASVRPDAFQSALDNLQHPGKPQA